MVLVTGGAGYIGSHTCISLIDAGYEIVVFDNFSNSSHEGIKRVEKIVGKKIALVEGDIRNRKDLQSVFDTYNIDSVVHFAGLKAVGESMQIPLQYYDNNVCGTVALCEVMQKNGCKKIVFSSSATVYGDPETVPIKEDFPLSATNPYGRNKLFIEKILRDVHRSDPTWKVIMLRYFNPAGAHISGTIGEDPDNIPNNLLPFIAQTAVGKREMLNIFGNDYDTPDGTGVRDYIHVVDLADGHVKALDKIDNFKEVMAINLGSGDGYSVFEIIHAFEKASGKQIPYNIVARRSGDIATCYADTAYAEDILGWSAKYNIDKMCEDVWRWQSKNPDGYN